MGEWTDRSADLYLAELRHLPPLSPDQLTQLAGEIREQEGEFRRALVQIPGAAVLVVERWRELRERGRVTGLLSHRYRDEAGVDWSAFIDERLGLLARCIARREQQRDATRRLRVDREMARILESAHILLEVLQEISLELRGLLAEPGSRALAKRRRPLGLDGRRARAALRRAEQALERRDTARQTFAAHNLRLVVHIAKRYPGHGVPLTDLVQEGSIGLLRAIDKFDERLGFRFSTYAVWWIEQAVIRAIQRLSRTVRVPTHVHEVQLRYKSALERLGARMPEPRPADLAADLGLPEEQVVLAASSLQGVRSLDALPGEPGGAPLRERLADESQKEPSEQLDLALVRSVLEGELERLEPRERKVLCWRFGLDEGDELTLQEIGERLGLSRERVRQIQNQAIARLRSRRRISRLTEMFPSAPYGSAARTATSSDS